METLNKVKSALLSMQRHSWEQGAAMSAFWELGDLETVITLAYEAANRAIPDGRVAIISLDEGITDPCSAGEVLLYATNATGDPQLKDAYDKLLDWALCGAPRSQSGTVYHVNGSKQFWIDSMYMLPPFLAAAGHFDEAIAQIDGYWNTLYIPEKRLLGHIWDDEKQMFLRSDCWGVGNGWAMAGLCRVIDLLPREMDSEREHLINRNRRLIASVVEYIRDDGLAYNVLDDCGTFVEANLPQMLAYAIYRGISSGWLDRLYLELADKCRLAVCAKVDDYGFVRDVCGAPTFDKPGIAPEGQAFFMLMHAAYSHVRG